MNLWIDAIRTRIRSKRPVSVQWLTVGRIVWFVVHSVPAITRRCGGVNGIFWFPIQRRRLGGSSFVTISVHAAVVTSVMAFSG